METFEFIEPTTVQEAVTLMGAYGDDAKPLAGGTDLIVELLQGAKPPGHLISLTRVETLSSIEDNGSLEIGATTSLHRVDQSVAVRTRCEMLSESAALIGSRQIRNLATIGGNLCNAVPSADTAPPLLAADAQIWIESPRGQRQLPATDFFKGPRETDLAADELVIKVLLPETPPRTGTVYRRHTPRHALDLAMVGVAVSITLEPGRDVISEARIALGAVAPIPFRASSAENVLKGHALSEALLDEAAELAVRASKPIGDVRGSAEYRREMIGVLTKRCVRQAFARAIASD